MVDDLRAEIKTLEEQLPVTGKKKLIKLDPFRFHCTISNQPQTVSVWFSRMDILQIMHDLFNAYSEGNDYCYYEIKNIYNLWDDGKTHLSIDLFAETEDLLKVLYVLDGICSKYSHEYKHQYRGDTFDTDERFYGFIDSISRV